MTTQEKLDRVAHYDYRVYSIPGAFVEPYSGQRAGVFLGRRLDRILDATRNSSQNPIPKYWMSPYDPQPAPAALDA